MLLLLVVGCGEVGSSATIPLVSLLVMPERHTDHHVAVRGYHRQGSEPSYLYLSESHARIWDDASGVILHETIDGRKFSSLRHCHNQYVEVIGRFVELPFGRHGISEIERVIALGNDSEDPRICFDPTRVSEFNNEPMGE